jgi:predicted lipoprotein with Yx(FWY)xxD motif
LLGTIHRPGIGDQVTYAGHPLYLFDPSSAPFKPLGEDYLETVAPLAPWHGYWSLVSASNGLPDAGTATIESGTLSSGERVVAVQDDPNINPLAVTVYSYSGGFCSDCAPEWIPVLTSATPLVRGVNAHEVGDVRLANGSFQVTYDAKPLYQYAKEKVSLTRNGDLDAAGTAGNGNGRSYLKGTFSLVALNS